MAERVAAGDAQRRAEPVAALDVDLAPVEVERGPDRLVDGGGDDEVHRRAQEPGLAVGAEHAVLAEARTGVLERRRHLGGAVGVELVVNEPIRTLETNLRETEVILQTAARCRIPLLITSTSEVYGKSQKEAFAETDDLIIGPPYLGRWRYACSKLMDEFLGLAYFQQKQLPVIIVRLFNTVGPRQTGRYGMVLPRFIQAALDGNHLKVYGSGTQTRCFCYIADTVESLLRLGNCTEAYGQIFNVGSDQEWSISSLADKVIALLNSKSMIIQVPYDQAYTPGFEDMMRRKPMISKLTQTIQFCPKTSLDDIILITASHLKQHHD